MAAGLGSSGGSAARPAEDRDPGSPESVPAEGSDALFSRHHDRRKVRDWAYEELRDAIVGLRLKPGEPLREAVIADGLGVSKTPIREAFGRLEQEGLVSTTSFKGAVVSSYSRDDLAEIYEIRELLEGACAGKAAVHASQDDVEKLRFNIVESAAARGEGRVEELILLLDQFDEIIYRQMDNGRLRALVDNLRAHLTRIGKLTEGIPGRIEASVDEHEAVVRAISARLPDEAEAAMRLHIRSVMADQFRSLDEHGFEIDAAAATGESA
jgi:DNA-binding GntR family transcriptional regulator